MLILRGVSSLGEIGTLGSIEKKGYKSSLISIHIYIVIKRWCVF
jgi:hypothetical protein